MSSILPQKQTAHVYTLEEMQLMRRESFKNMQKARAGKISRCWEPMFKESYDQWSREIFKHYGKENL